MTDLDEQLRALLVAATRFAGAAQRAYREQHPEDHAAYCVLVERGGGQLYATVTLTPAPHVEVGVARGEQRDAFFSWPGSTGLRAH